MRISLAAIRRLGACNPARKWMAANASKSLREMWNTCPYPNWQTFVLMSLEERGVFIDWRRIALAMFDARFPYMPESQRTIAGVLLPELPIIQRLIQAARDYNAGRIELVDMATVHDDAYDYLKNTYVDYDTNAAIGITRYLTLAFLYQYKITELVEWIGDAGFNYLANNNLPPLDGKDYTATESVYDEFHRTLARAVNAVVPYDSIRPHILTWQRGESPAPVFTGEVPY